MNGLMTVTTDVRCCFGGAISFSKVKDENDALLMLDAEFVKCWPLVELTESSVNSVTENGTDKTVEVIFEGTAAVNGIYTDVCEKAIEECYETVAGVMPDKLRNSVNWADASFNCNTFEWFDDLD